ncbi:hypothetical protein GCM10027361_29140 [Erwinia aphidicola]
MVCGHFLLPQEGPWSHVIITIQNATFQLLMDIAMQRGAWLLLTGWQTIQQYAAQWLGYLEEPPTRPL